MASELNTKASAIETYIADNWDENDVPVAWPGHDFEPPDGIWMRVDITWGDGFIETMGGSGRGTNTVVGVLTLNLFAPPGRGAGPLETKADEARDLFNRAEVDGVRFDAPSGPKPAPRREPDWLQRTVTVPFELIETI